jgi:hypothetical protein
MTQAAEPVPSGIYNPKGATAKPAVSINTNEWDGHAAVLWGALFRQTSPVTPLQALNFGADIGYRFFNSLPNLSLGLRGYYFSAGTGQTGLAFYAMGEWFFSDSRTGFFAGLGAGYSLRTAAGGIRGVSVYPLVGYQLGLPFADNLAIGLDLGALLTLATPLDTLWMGSISVKLLF